MLVLWAVLMACVVIGSLLPAESAVLVAVSRLPISDKWLHFFAYLAMSALPVIGFRDRPLDVSSGGVHGSWPAVPT